MAIPGTSASALRQAMRRFEGGERSPSWREPSQGWLADPRRDAAIVHEGRRYPLKEIVRLAVRWTTTL